MWHGEVTRHIADERVDLLVAINGSPFERGKQAVRRDHALSRVRQAGCPLLYVNQVGGQDELVFDGASFVMDASGTVVAQSPAFVEDEFRFGLRRLGPGSGQVEVVAGREDAYVPYPDDLEATYAALVLATRDYVLKNGFPGVVIGESGGIDSALVTAISVDALGAGKVRAVTMPSRHNGPGGIADAAESARLTGASFESIAIQPIYEAFLEALPFGGLPRDVTEENLQARIRGTLLMSLSNKFGPMLLTTGNKSEMSVGYATLYGDMSGGFNPLKDIFKTDVYALARWRNAAGRRPDIGLAGPAGPLVPAGAIDKPPSAELAEGQSDEAVLGPYPVLDALLKCIVEDDASPAVAARAVATALSIDPSAPCGRSPDLPAHATWVARLVQRAEYKRRQSAPGPKVSSRNLGRDRRYPITTGGEL
jgi:NAD+ synthase